MIRRIWVILNKLLTHEKFMPSQKLTILVESGKGPYSSYIKKNIENSTYFLCDSVLLLMITVFLIVMLDKFLVMLCKQGRWGVKR